ncbi:DNA cytosine methyltransferase [Bacillus amyloliquefaciens]|uniref:DNA cytosine methyltransferase n=3 Tax=Bacillus amyloliquefaciens group TaxID=1938374 RepID=UPI003A8BB623
MITMLLKKRKAKISARGVYLQDQQLSDTQFAPGAKFKYIIDPKKNQLLIVPSNKEGNTVSKRSIKTGVKPVIDIRKREVLSLFTGLDFLEIEIYEDKIKVTGLKNAGSNIVPLSVKQKRAEITFSRNSLNQAVGEAFPISKTTSKFLSNIIKNPEEKGTLLKTISLFSGAGILDQGFIESGFNIVLALEKDQDAVTTYRYNHGDHVVQCDIKLFDYSLFKKYKAPVMIGGAPCQGFSLENKHAKDKSRNILEDPNNELINYYINAVKANPYCKVFVLENVPQILTAGNGVFKDAIYNALSDFEITSGIINAADMGDPQMRKRAIFIGSKIGKIPLPNKERDADSYTTVRDAFAGITENLPNQKDVSKPRQETVEKMKHVPPGGNWRNIPDHLKTAKMLSKNGVHSSIFRRLEWDKPSVTITNVRKTLMTHPVLNRTLTVRECARLFSLPDTFKFFGKLGSIQQQLANAVPVKLARSVANAVKNRFKEFHTNQKLVSLY